MYFFVLGFKFLMPTGHWSMFLGYLLGCYINFESASESKWHWIRISRGVFYQTFLSLTYVKRHSVFLEEIGIFRNWTKNFRSFIWLEFLKLYPFSSSNRPHSGSWPLAQDSRCLAVSSKFCFYQIIFLVYKNGLRWCLSDPIFETWKTIKWYRLFPFSFLLGKKYKNPWNSDRFICKKGCNT